MLCYHLSSYSTIFSTMDVMPNDTFSNDQIPSNQIPTVSDLDLEGLDKRYLTAELIGSAIFWTLLGGGGLVLIYLNLWKGPDWLSLVLMPLLLVIILISFLTTIFGFKRKKYALREKDIIYQAGLFWSCLLYTSPSPRDS